MLHRHAAAIRPYPLPTRQHAAARPNSRQIRQMSAMPANLPFRSQFAARPNNRRHHQPTATHPQTTSTPNLSQTLMISRQTLVISRKALIRALASSRRPSHPENPPNPANPASDNPHNANHSPSPISQKSQFRQRSNTRPALICSRRPSHRENPPKSCFRQSAQRKSQPIPNIPKITVQTTVKHSPASSVRGAPPIPKIPPNPANPVRGAHPIPRDNPPNANHSPSPISQKSQFRQRSNTRPNTHLFAAPLPSRKSPQILQILLQTIRPTQITAHPQYPKNHSSDNGQTLARPLICSRRPSHPENPPKSCKSCFRQSAQRKSQPIPNIPKITVQTTVKHSPGHSSVRGAPPIPKIPPNPANPASDNPPNANHSPSPISQKSQFRQRSNTRPATHLFAAPLPS